MLDGLDTSVGADRHDRDPAGDGRRTLKLRLGLRRRRRRGGERCGTSPPPRRFRPLLPDGPRAARARPRARWRPCSAIRRCACPARRGGRRDRPRLHAPSARAATTTRPPDVGEVRTFFVRPSAWRRGVGLGADGAGARGSGGARLPPRDGLVVRRQRPRQRLLRAPRLRARRRRAARGRVGEHPRGPLPAYRHQPAAHEDREPRPGRVVRRRSTAPPSARWPARPPATPRTRASPRPPCRPAAPRPSTTTAPPRRSISSPTAAGGCGSASEERDVSRRGRRGDRARRAATRCGTPAPSRCGSCAPARRPTPTTDTVLTES